MNDIDEQEFGEDHIRSFEEFDEKLPSVAKVIVRRGINFQLLNEGDNSDKETPEEFEARREVFMSIYAIFREMVLCTSEMTADEFEYYTDALLTACELVVMVNSGMAYEKEKGRFTLTKKGEEHYREFESCED